MVITAPDGTPDSALPTWTFRAQQIMNGGSGVLPSGAKVDELTAARGQDPFSTFCQHQMEVIAILATGGTLNTIGGATGLGSNLADVQNDQFNKLVRKDIRKIEKAMTKVVGVVARGMGLDPAGLRFNFVSDEDDTKEVLEVADKMKGLGLTIDVEKMRKYIKYDIMSDAQKDLWTPDSADAEPTPADENAVDTTPDVVDDTPDVSENK